MPQLKTLRFLKMYFVSNFHSNDFSYVLYPFLRIFKIFGYTPIKLALSNNLLQKGERVECDLVACLWTAFGAATYFVGFSLGVHHLRQTEDFKTLYDTSSLAFYTIWAQIVTLFVLGALAVLTSWTHLSEQRQLCALIYKIDQDLKAEVDANIDYKAMRTRLFVEFVAAFVVPTASSMVNCVVIQPTPQTFSLFNPCFWFICFAPIMLLTLKEFQFFTLLTILRSKFALINAKLQEYIVGSRVSSDRPSPPTMMCDKTEIPLSANCCSSAEQVVQPNIKTMRALLEIYSQTADALDMVLQIFAWHLVFLTAVSVGVITIQSYNLFTLIAHSMQMQPHQVFFIILWIVVQVLAIGINVSACSMTSNMMSATGPLLHKIKLEYSADDVGLFYQTIQIFSLEVLQRKNNFTAGGFFDINYRLITSIIAAVSTYLVIIIQFHLTNIPDGHHHYSPPV